MAISKDGKRLGMNGTLIVLAEDVLIRRSEEHLSGKYKKVKKTDLLVDIVTFSHNI